MELEILVSCFFDFTKNIVHLCEIFPLEIVTILKKWYNIKNFALWENKRG